LNAVYSPIFMEIRERLFSILKPDVLLNMKKNFSDIEKFLEIHEVHGTNINYVENDFSKFDKSQQWTCLRLEWELYEMLGLDIVMSDMWKRGHVSRSVRSTIAGIKVYSMLQRCSGDATTALGNSIVNMLSVSATYDMKDYYYAMFLGDDSLVAMPRKIDTTDVAESMAGMFNLAAKTIQSPYGFFCSAFVVKAGGHVRYMSDPVKRIEKLGAWMSLDEDKFEEKFISFKDLVGNYNDIRFLESLNEAVTFRYNTSYNMTSALQALYELTVNKEAFRSLYAENSSVYEF